MPEYVSNNLPYLVSLGMSIIAPITGAVISMKIMQKDIENIKISHIECRTSRKRAEEDIRKNIADMNKDLSFLYGKMNGRKNES